MNSGKNKIIMISIAAVSVAVLIFSSFLFVRGICLRSAWQNPLTIDQAAKLAEDHLKSLNNEDLAIDEIMEFEFNFYIVFYEENTGIGAFEAIIDKRSAGMGGMMGMMMGYGYVRPEQGPNMMWNTKYDMHGGSMDWMHSRNTYANTSITGERAKEYAQEYLDKHFPSTIAEEVHSFYGYYTIHAMKEDEIFGMLSVNSATGQVWYHN